MENRTVHDPCGHMHRNHRLDHRHPGIPGQLLLAMEINVVGCQTAPTRQQSGDCQRIGIIRFDNHPGDVGVPAYPAGRYARTKRPDESMTQR